MNGYSSKMDGLNSLFKYITEREGYQNADTWALHADEVIDKLQSMEKRALNTKDQDLQAIRAAVFHMVRRPLAKQIDAIYVVYHDEIRKSLKTKPGPTTA